MNTPLLCSYTSVNMEDVKNFSPFDGAELIGQAVSYIERLHLATSTGGCMVYDVSGEIKDALRVNHVFVAPMSVIELRVLTRKLELISDFLLEGPGKANPPDLMEKLIQMANLMLHMPEPEKER